jgi:hypothetical protein
MLEKGILTYEGYRSIYLFIYKQEGIRFLAEADTYYDPPYQIHLTSASHQTDQYPSIEHPVLRLILGSTQLKI